MRNPALLLLILLFCLPAPYSTTLGTPGSTRPSSEKIDRLSFLSQGKKRSFYLFVPDSVKTANPVPLIVLLHGSGRNGLSLVEKWKDLAGREGIIIAGPDAANSNGWSTSEDGPEFLHDLVEYLKSKYPINSKRIYLFGHSAGAVYALSISMIESEYFAATAIHAGAWRDQREFSVIDNAQRKIPLAIWVGTNDSFFPLRDVRATRDALQAKGFTIEVTEMPGHDHWYYDLAPKINQSAWEFLKKYELSGEQKYAAIATQEDASRANSLIQEMNNLKNSAFEVSQQAESIDAEFMRKDFAADRDEVRRLAQRELELLNKSATLWSEAADKADSAAQLKLNDRHTQYFLLISRYMRKYAEAVKASYGKAEAALNSESAEIMRAKRNEAISQVAKLQREVLDLQDQLEALMK
jgi:predicted esterase